MNEAELNFRLAEDGDMRLLWRWRNEPAVRAASLSQDEMTLEAHATWFAEAMADPEREILIAETDKTRIGMVRFDRNGAYSTVNIILAPEARGKRLSRPVLLGAIQSTSSKTGRLRATIRKNNAASIALFRSLGFHEIDNGDPLVLERRGDI